jgi:CRP/FNR family cyclic AMP-dependent transcriptional regulator
LIRCLADNDVVHGLGFWGLLGEEDRKALTSAARSRVFPADFVLCMEGEPTTHVFILLSGWVKVSTVTRDGREVLEALRGAGDIVGEIAGQVTGYRTATVQALGTVRALIVGAGQFGDFLDAHPGAAHAHRQAMAERQRTAYEQQRGHALLSGAQRLAGLLLDLADEQDGASGGAVSTPLPLSQEELASLIGASRSTVTRALHEWRSRRVIGTDQRHIKILDRAWLLRISGRPQ